MGNYMVDDGGNITMSGDASQGIKDQRVTFVNNGDVAAKVTGAKISIPMAANGLSITLRGVPMSFP